MNSWDNPLKYREMVGGYFSVKPLPFKQLTSDQLLCQLKQRVVWAAFSVMFNYVEPLFHEEAAS